MSDDINNDLCKPISEEEVKASIFNLGAYKALDPNGYQGFFYQKYREIIKTDVVHMVQEFLHPGVLLCGIALIPKVKNPQSFAQLRPICLCNFLYKVIAKMLANRLKPQLDRIISSLQAAFVPNQTIQDNILVANEAFHSLNNRRQGRTGAFSIKLGFQ